jgi:dienelactone hydrolase
LTDAAKGAAVTLTERSRHVSPRRHPATPSWVLILLLGIASVVAACGRNDASPTATTPPPPRVPRRPHLGHPSLGEAEKLFHYNQRRPLAITRQALTTRLSANELRGVTVHSITYASPKGGEVPALLVIPKGKGPFPGVIVQHGLPSTKEDFLPVGIDLARTGAVAILIDAPFNRPQQGTVRGDLSGTAKDRGEQIQLIIDLRRAVDLLIARPDVNKAQLAYVGISYGAAMGGLLAGVEDRITAYVLTVGDGGLVSHFTGPNDPQPPPPMSAEDWERWLAAMRPIEPINFIGRAAPAALLFQAGTKDELVPPEDARRYQQAAGQPKEIRWYEAGHELNCTAREDMMTWLARHIRIDPTRYRYQP